MKKIIYSLLFIMISSNIIFAQEKIEEKDEKKEKTNKNLPIKPDRFYDLNTDTGTWMSLDVSPDGQKIVFDLLGDLYMIPISGGKATRITKGMAFDTISQVVKQQELQREWLLILTQDFLQMENP